jgi:hypothetical protein
MPTEKIKPKYDPSTLDENNFGSGVVTGQRNNMPIEQEPIGYCSGSTGGAAQAKETEK